MVIGTYSYTLQIVKIKSNMSSMPNDHYHSKIESNHIDPDDGNSWLCTACNLPIFATPFTGGGTTALLHDQCVDLPEILKNYELHPQKPLFLGDNKSSATCSECSEKCGSKLYFCPDPDCGLVLDVACALPIRILHRSHRHRLMAVRGSSFHKCGICGVAHQATTKNSRSYFCSVCGFWIHPDCATSAHVIVHEKHVHPLVLYYDVHDAFGAQAALVTNIFAPDMFDRDNVGNSCSICAICGNDVVATSFGVYSCMDCRNCILHINCATSDHWNFKSVLGREAQFANVVRLPIPDEHHSIVSNTTYAASNNISNYDHDPNYNPSMAVEYLHGLVVGDKHPFTLQHDITKTDEDERRVCDACLKIVKSPDPFYSCTVCPNFFLHDSCFHLPTLLKENPTHQRRHHLMFSTRDHIQNNLGRSNSCHHCKCQFIRASYLCIDCNIFNLDVSCALMPSVVTHDEHATAHFLRLLERESYSHSRVCCNCCGQSLGKLAYECRTCQNFSLHTWCAMLPKNVTHKFDPHHLHLITNKQSNNNGVVYDDICEICENMMDDKVWYYGCKICSQSFHVDCIPCLDLMYKIKSLVRAGRIREGIPTRLIRGLTLQGHGHDYCSNVADEYDDIISNA